MDRASAPGAGEPGTILGWREAPNYPIDKLRMFVDAAVNGQTNSQIYPGSQFDFGYRFADSASVGEGLANPDQAHEMLTMIDDLLSVTTTRTKDQKDCYNMRYRIGGMVYQHAEAITSLAGQSGEAGLLARVVIFKTWGLREAGTMLDAQADRTWLELINQNLPEVIMASQASMPESVQGTLLESFANSLFRLSDTDQAGRMLAVIAQVIDEPATQTVGRAIHDHAEKYIGETMPASEEELAYKIQLSNMALLLDRLGPTDPDLITSIIERLDAAGQTNGWNAKLWDIVAEDAKNSHISNDVRQVTTSMLFARYGLDYDQLVSDWVIGSGYEQTDWQFIHHRDLNVKRIIDLERAKPGASKLLNAPPYRIRNFARVPLNALVAQANAIGQRNLSHALVGLGFYENKADPKNRNVQAHSPDSELGLWRNLYLAATAFRITLMFHEGDGHDFLRVLGTAVNRYGQSAEFGVAKFHNSDAPVLGPGSSCGDRPSQREITAVGNKHSTRKYLQSAFKPHGELVLIACHAGEQGNTAQTLHRLLGNTIVGPDYTTNGFIDDRVTLTPDSRGGYRLGFAYRTTDHHDVNAVRYAI